MKLSEYIKVLQDLESVAGDFYIVNSEKIIEPYIDFGKATIDLDFEEKIDDYSASILEEIRMLVG